VGRGSLPGAGFGGAIESGGAYKNWPWYRGNVEQHKEQGQFSHTYQERFWPRQAGDTWVKGYEDRDFAAETKDNVGLRYRYGDLNDVLDLLAREPYTRQAYLPIFFPEDTGAHHGERIPCTLGYHLMLRDNQLHCFYPMRSCDYIRYFADDAYMAARLVQWVIDELQDREGIPWSDITPGFLNMSIASLHVFEGDMPKLRRELND
jgi:thymidylate synthase